MPGRLEDGRDHLTRIAFVPKDDVFSEKLPSTYIDYKRIEEGNAVRRALPYKFALYYDIEGRRVSAANVASAGPRSWQGPFLGGWSRVAADAASRAWQGWTPDCDNPPAQVEGPGRKRLVQSPNAYSRLRRAMFF
jgi:hypothetical protein